MYSTVIVIKQPILHTFCSIHDDDDDDDDDNTDDDKQLLAIWHNDV